jgi:hypothetical protein
MRWHFTTPQLFVFTYVIAGCLSLGVSTLARADEIVPASTEPLSSAAVLAPIQGPIYSTAIFLGGDGRGDMGYGYIGALHAVNGNLASDGIALRVIGLYDQYSYSTTPSVSIPGGRVNADAGAAEALIGYQKVLPAFTARIFAGLDYEGNNLRPYNKYDSNAGTSFGVRVLGQLETAYASELYGSLHAEWGSARERYWVRGRAGYNFGEVIIGPEGLITGNPVSTDHRVGGFTILRIPSLSPFELSVSAGFSRVPETRGGRSPYGTIEVSTAF